MLPRARSASESIRKAQTQIFIETPYRKVALLQALLGTLRGTTRLALASGLTLPGQRTRCVPVQRWKQDAATLAAWSENRLPTVFALGT